MGTVLSAESKPVTGADVRVHSDGYSVILRSGARFWPEREGRRVRRWSRLEQALAHVVSQYGVHSVRLRLPSENRS